MSEFIRGILAGIVIMGCVWFIFEINPKTSFYSKGLREGTDILKKATIKKKGTWFPIMEMDSHGEIYPSAYQCSECHDEFGTEFDYCPHCGAQMEK